MSVRESVSGDRPQIFLQGWLSKYGLSVLGLPGNTPRRRFCVLSSGRLDYYKVVEGQEKKRDLRGSLKLTKSSTVGGDQNKLCTFYVTPVPSGRIYHFEADTETECKQWVESIRQMTEEGLSDSREEAAEVKVLSTLDSSLKSAVPSCTRVISSFIGAEVGELLNEEFQCSVCDQPIKDHDSGGADTTPALGSEDYLRDLTQRMSEAVEVKDRWYFGRQFEKCFLGSEAVAWLMSPFSCHCTEEGVPIQRDLKDAILLGNMLMSKGYFKHVTDGHPFKNERLFYRFADIPVRVVLETCEVCEYVFPMKANARVFNCLRCQAKTDRTQELEHEVRKASQDYAEKKDNVEGPVMRASLRASMHARTNSTGSFVEEFMMNGGIEPEEDPMENEALVLLADRMKAGIDVRDRSWRFRTYKQCFLGVDAVKWLRESSGVCKDTEQAIMIGNLMMAQDLFQHVVNAHPLKNEKLFYHFVSSEKPALSNAFFAPSLMRRQQEALLENSEEEVAEEEEEDEDDDADDGSELTIRIYNT